MDIGVGSFVFSQGIISALPLLKYNKTTSLWIDLVQSIRKCFPVLLLGLIRVLMVKSSEYPVSLIKENVKHTSQYPYANHVDVVIAGENRNMSRNTAYIGISSSH
jgi:hypothetical protein